jgi:hypothetical protein
MWWVSTEIPKMSGFYKPALYPTRAMPYAIDMARSTGDIPNGTPNDISRLTVPEAAQVLGISPEAVRNRLSRGTLKSEREKGTVYVLLEIDRSRSTTDTPNDQSRHTGDRSSDISGDPSALISAKDETIRVLTEQLEAERAAGAELRRIVAGLVQRVPELEPARESSSVPPEATGEPETVAEEPYSTHAPPQPEKPVSGEQESKRSWWREFFGLE